MMTNRSPKISDIFETHLTVRNLDRSIHFYRDRLGPTRPKIRQKKCGILLGRPKSRWYAGL